MKTIAEQRRYICRLLLVSSIGDGCSDDLRFLGLASRSLRNRLRGANSFSTRYGFRYRVGSDSLAFDVSTKSASVHKTLIGVVAIMGLSVSMLDAPGSRERERREGEEREEKKVPAISLPPF